MGAHPAKMPIGWAHRSIGTPIEINLKVQGAGVEPASSEL
jgi:hypothetical protein